MSPVLITAILGIVLSVLTLGQVAPSISQMIVGKRVEIGLNREKALMQQIVRYQAVEGTWPATVADLVTKGYWKTSDNNNGFGSGYTFTVDSAKGLITISTTIADATKRAQYLNNYRHVFRPIDVGGGVVNTTFITPRAGAAGAPVPTTGSIPISATAPNAATNTYWYDTSGSSAVLKVSDGVSWMVATTSSSGGGITAPSDSNIIANIAALPATGATGDIRYVYSAAGNSLNAYVYYNGQWVQAGTGSGSTCVGGAAGSGNPISALGCIQSALVAANSSCTFNDGFVAADGTDNYYACTDIAVAGGDLTGVSCTNTNRVTYDLNGNAYQCL